MTFCCAECFGDRGLREDIIPLLSGGTGVCSYCLSDGVCLVEPLQLNEYFELLISAYQADAGGRPLVRWLREDWGLFDHPRMDDSHAKELLAEVLDDGEIVRNLFVPVLPPDRDWLLEWEKLRDELRYHNRFFPKIGIPLDRLSSLLRSLQSEGDDIAPMWYRARIQAGPAVYAADGMGAPPKEVATHGRANPAGIPYLYLASTAQTAISETRPHTGETVCVAEFQINRSIKVIDLRTPRKTVSPFLLTDADEVGRMRNDLPFLERLGDELTRPVLPQTAVIDYTPSQYLCEFIKAEGYDGVLYRSSVSDGVNLALFDPLAASCGVIRSYCVKTVTIDAVSV